MGCGASRLEPEEQLAPGLRPIRRKIEEVKRRRRRLKRYSIVSTTELLRPEDHADSEDEEEEDEETTMTPPLEQVVEEEEKTIQSKKTDFFVGDEEKKVEEVKEPAAPESVEEEEEKKGRKLGNVKRAAAEGDEELPGSPSFRFYCTDSVRDSDDDSVKLAGFRIAEKLEEIKEKPQERDDSAENSCEESELKHIKKEKGKKFRALTKALNVRNCYNNPSAASQHNGPHLLSEKAA